MRHHGVLLRGSRSFLPSGLLIIGLLLLFSWIFSTIYASGSAIAEPPISGDHRFAIVRVAFQPDTSDLTTGTGEFNLETMASYPDTVIDPPPHTASYFRDQTKALNNYYSRVSGQQLTVNWQSSDIFPAGEEASYTLPSPMEDYGKGFTDSTQEKHWADLLYDTYEAADGDVDFAQYSTLVIFHAGVGQDFDIPLDDTPYDIQSAYLDPEFISTHFSGTQLTNLQNAGIEHVLILPETQTQLDISIGLTGTYALLFGSRIGLPAMYNTENGQSVVGKFGLMDLGSNNASGIAPAYPTAWTRIYAGWAEASTVTNSGTYSVQSAEAQGDNPEILKVPINSTEYYLVENRLRQTRESALDSFIVNFDTLFVQRDSETYVITNVEEYDAGLPGDGLLIWHIDESVIQANLASNSLNTNPERRGIDLEEADGAQDIGEYYGDFSGGVENGWFFDLWFAGNTGFFHLNPDYKTDADSTIGFAPSTFPATWTNSGAYTGISITDIPAADSLVNVKINFNRMISGFPAFGPAQVSDKLLSISGAQSDYFVNAVTEPNASDSLWIHIYPGNQSFSVQLPESDDYSIRSLTGHANAQSQLILGVLSASSDSTALSEFIISADGSVGAQHLSTVAGQAASQLMSDTTGYIFATSVRRVYRFERTGSPDWSTEIPDSITGLTRNAIGEIFAGTNAGLYRVRSDSTVNKVGNGVFREILSTGNSGIFARKKDQLALAASSNSHGFLPSNPALPKYISIFAADLDNDGANNIICLIQDNEQWKIIAYNDNSAVVNNFPIPLQGTFQHKNIAIADVNANDIPEIFAVNDSGRIYGYNRFGELLPHFPIDVGAQVAAPLAIENFGNRAGLLVQDISGALHGYYVYPDPDIPFGKMIWSGRHGDPSNSRMVTETAGGPAPEEKPIIERAYVYPNPIRADYATIRVELNTGDDFHIIIYDFSGRQLQEWDVAVNEGDRVYEIPWDTGDLPSGVYFAEVTISAGSSDEVKIVKIAKIK